MKIQELAAPCFAIASLLLLTQCAEDPADSASSATTETVSDAEAEAAAMELANSLDFGFADDSDSEAATPPEESRMFVFGGDSKIGFIGSKPTAIHEGSFSNFSGHFSVIGDAIDVDGLHRISIDMASVTTGDEKLTEHLKSEDFFDVAKFPVATFSLLKMVKIGDQPDSYDAVGILDLHGVKKKITFPATLTVAEGRDSVAMQAKFSIDRKTFGIEYPGLPDDLIRDRVVIDLDLKAEPGDPAALQLTGVETQSQPMVLSAPQNAGDPRLLGAGAGGGGGGGQPGFGRGGGGGPRGTPAETIARMDGNGDGKLSKDEVPEGFWERLSSADGDGDGSITEAEYTKYREQREAEGGGFGGDKGGGVGKGGGGKGGGDGGDRTN